MWRVKITMTGRESFTGGGLSAVAAAIDAIDRVGATWGPSVRAALYTHLIGHATEDSEEFLSQPRSFGTIHGYTVRVEAEEGEMVWLPAEMHGVISEVLQHSCIPDNTYHRIAAWLASVESA